MTTDFVSMINTLSGWVREMGVVILTATPEEVTGTPHLIVPTDRKT
jgi:hypothetical protein